jgi:hypothetical protein
MNVSRSFTLAGTPWSVGLSVLFALVTAGYAVAAWRRSGCARAVGALELLRVVLVALVAALLNQPEWVAEYRPEEKPAVAVLWDASASMDTRDVAAARGSRPATRREAIAPFIDPASWQRLRPRMDLAIMPFSAGRNGHGTDLSDPLTRAPEQVKNLRGVVLVSDGDWNEGPPPAQAAARLRVMGVPVLAVPVGSPARLPDVELLSLDAPTFGVAGKAVRVPFTIESALPREYVTTVSLRTSGGDEVTKQVRIPPMGRTSDWVLWKPAEHAVGDQTLTLTVPRLADNNRLSAPIAIRRETLKVLVVESVPRWEYRYLRNALSRDPGVEVSCLLFHPGLSKVGGGNKDYIKEFPSGLDELSRYDVVFLGDVGLDGGQLTTEQCRLLKGLVEHHASGLVFLPGMEGRQLSLLDTDLADLLPVVLDPSQPGGWGTRAPSHFELTETGRRSLLTKLADTEDENVEVWENLPGFQWYAPVLSARAGSAVLCVHKDATTGAGRLPLLVTRTFGAGKVLFMGTDGAWRWRKGVEDRYHYRFWGQVVRWMAYQRNMAKGETMRLFYAPDQPRADQSVALHASVMDRGGEPLRRGEVAARIKAPSGKAETVRLASAGDEWGVFHGRYGAGEPGTHQITVYCKETGATLETTFFVQGAARERIGRPARPDVMEEIARVTRGRVLAPDQLNAAVSALAELPEPPPAVRRVQLWSHPAVAGTLVALLGVFWMGRKAIGLI